jgi:hypothetical protein
MIDAEEVVAPKVTVETRIGNAIPIVASALRPAAVFGIPRCGAGLNEAAAHLSLMLRDTALMNSTIGGGVSLHVAMIAAPVSLLRGTGGRSGMSLLCRAGLLLMALMLCENRCGRSNKQQEHSRADYQFLWHTFLLLKTELMIPIYL